MRYCGAQGVHRAYTARTHAVHREVNGWKFAGFWLIAITALMLTLLPAQSAVFAPPAGCDLTMTVQNRGCRVTQYYICDADPAGDQRSTTFDEEGPVSMTRIDAETRWMETRDLTNGIIDKLVPLAADHASFATLIETGRDNFDFWTLDDRGQRLRNIGEDVLTGETQVIDGVELELTEFRLRIFGSGGEQLFDARGQQFISREHGRFYGGIETWADWTGEVSDVDNSPVSFAMPGDPGFGSTTPLYDCSMQMVQAASRPVNDG